MSFSSQFSLHGQYGERKYLNSDERARFYNSTTKLNLERKLFCRLLYFTGARLGEIHSLRIKQINFSERVLTINTLKRRRNDIYRQMPLPDHLLAELKAMITSNQDNKEIIESIDHLWSFSRRTSSRIITTVMEAAGIEGVKASALGLRHGFAVFAVTRVPLTQVKTWMGHAYMSTTALYLEVSGIEERKWAEKLWEEKMN